MSTSDFRCARCGVSVEVCGHNVEANRRKAERLGETGGTAAHARSPGL